MIVQEQGLSCVKCKKELPAGSVWCPWCGKKQASAPRKRSKRPHGTGTVYSLSGRRNRPWMAVRDGVTVGYYETKKEALEGLERVSGKKLTDRYNMTFKEVYEGWKEEHFQEIGKSGVAQYERALTVFGDLHDRTFRDLRTSDFQAILDRYKDLSESTVGKYKQLVTSMSDWAIREEIITTNFASFAKARGRASVPHEPMSAEEILRIQAAAAEDDAAKIVCMMLATGLRIGELFRLPKEDLHGAYLVGGEKSDAGISRIVPIRPEGLEYFTYFAAQATGPLLLSGYKGNRDARNFRNRDYYSLLDRLGIDRSKTPHSTRTTYTTRAVDEGLSPAVAQKVLGHADFDTTQRYYNRPDAEALVRAVNKAARKSKRLT